MSGPPADPYRVPRCFVATSAPALGTSRASTCWHRPLRTSSPTLHSTVVHAQYWPVPPARVPAFATSSAIGKKPALLPQLGARLSNIAAECNSSPTVARASRSCPILQKAAKDVGEETANLSGTEQWQLQLHLEMITRTCCWRDALVPASHHKPSAEMAPEKSTLLS